MTAKRRFSRLFRCAGEMHPTFEYAFMLVGRYMNPLEAGLPGMRFKGITIRPMEVARIAMRLEKGSKQ